MLLNAPRFCDQSMANRSKTAKKSTKRKKIRYRKVSLKITAVQKKKIDRFCLFHQTTMNRFVKKAIRDYLEMHGADIPEETPVVKNQLKLFDPDDFKSGRQMDIFDELCVQEPNPDASDPS